jgi:hypothetical protein
MGELNKVGSADGADIAPARNQGAERRRASPGRPHGTAIGLGCAHRSKVARQWLK